MDATTITTAGDIVAFIEHQPWMMALLDAVARLDLPDAWIAAGFVRNPVWDVLHGRVPVPGALADVDVVFFDPAETGREREHEIERMLAAMVPTIPWSVRNQARMHLRNNDPPYGNTSAALTCWLETATAVGARLSGQRVDLLCPFGVEDLVGLILRPTTRTSGAPAKLEQYRQRVREKGWMTRWPRLRVVGLAT